MSVPVDCLALLAACVVEQYGESGTYSHRGGAGVTVYGSPGKRQIEIVRQNGIDIELIQMSFTLPKQTNFPPDATKDGGGITIDDTLTLNGRVYYVMPGTTQDSSRAVYVLNLENEEARRLKG